MIRRKIESYNSVLELLILIHPMVFFLFFIIFVLIQYIFLLYIKRLKETGMHTQYLYKESNFKFYFIFYKIEILLILISLLYLCIQMPVNYASILNVSLITSRDINVSYNFFLFINIFFIYCIIKFKDYSYYIESLFIYMFILMFTYFLFCADNFIILYLAFEGISLCSFILLVINYSILKTTNVNLKYFILSCLFSLLFLFAIVLIYINFGTTRFSFIQRIIGLCFKKMQQNQNPGSVHVYPQMIVYFIKNPVKLYFDLNYLILSFFLIIVVLFFKIGLFPFYFWVVEVYKKLSILNLMFFSVYLKYIYMVILLKFSFNFFRTMTYYFEDIFIFIGVSSILIASISVIKSYHIREIIAYSSMLNLGFIVLGLCQLTLVGIIVSQCYLIFYILVMLIFFFIILKLKELNIYAYDILADFNGLYLNSVFFTSVLIFVLLTLAGLPPFMGFFYKLGLLLGVVREGIFENKLPVFMILPWVKGFEALKWFKIILIWMKVFVILFVLLLNLISCFIYLRVCAHIFFYKNVSYKLVNLKQNFLEILIFIIFIIFIFSGYTIYLQYYLYLFELEFLEGVTLRRRKFCIGCV